MSCTALWVNANRDGDNGCCSWWVVVQGDFNKSEKLFQNRFFFGHKILCFGLLILLP